MLIGEYLLVKSLLDLFEREIPTLPILNMIAKIVLLVTVVGHVNSAV